MASINTQEYNKMHFSAKRRYLFFVSQDYSFPVLRPLQDVIKLNGDTIKWFLYGDEINHKHLITQEIQLSTIDEVIDYNPHVVFVPGNVVPSFISGLKVQVFHGLPSAKTKKNGQLYHYIIRGMFDLYCTQGPSSTSKFELLAKQYKSFSVKETGWCKLDPLFKNTNESKSLKQKSIFFASTFSPRFSKAEVLFPFILNMIKKHNIKWYITLHPKMDTSIVDKYKSIDSNNVIFMDSVDVIQNFQQTDLMLCDTSSIIYEYITQKKPVITFQTQKDEPYLINVTDISKLENIIISTLNNPDVNKNNIEKSVKAFHPYTDGNASKRVLAAVNKMLEGENLPLRHKPYNFIRNIKLRKALNYWSISSKNITRFTSKSEEVTQKDS